MNASETQKDLPNSHNHNANYQFESVQKKNRIVGITHTTNSIRTFSISAEQFFGESGTRSTDDGTPCQKIQHR